MTAGTLTAWNRFVSFDFKDAATGKMLQRRRKADRNASST